MYAITCIVFSFSSQQLDALTYKSLNLSLYIEPWLMWYSPNYFYF